MLGAGMESGGETKWNFTVCKVQNGRSSQLLLPSLRGIDAYSNEKPSSNYYVFAFVHCKEHTEKSS